MKFIRSLPIRKKGLSHLLHQFKRRSRASIAACLVAAVCVVAAWYPFEVDLPRYFPNGAIRLSDGAITFVGRGRVFAFDPFHDGGRPDEIFVEALLARLDQTGPARLLAVGNDPYTPSFLIGVLRGRVVVRIPCEGDGESEWEVPYTTNHHLAVRVRLSGLGQGESALVSVNGEAPIELKNRCPEGRSLRWLNRTMPWTLGNDYTGHRPFAGTILEVSVTRNRVNTDALRDIEWEMPGTFWLWPERLYQPTDFGWGEAAVGALHFVGFLILGLLLRLARPRDSNAKLFLTVVVFSFAINLGKILVAGRHPTVLDFALNVFGAAVAITAMCKLGRNVPGKPP